MDNSTIERLARLEGSPAVSIYCPLDARRPGNEHDPVVLAGLRDRAARRVLETAADEAAQRLIARLDDAIETIDLRHPAPGAAIFVSPDTAEVVALDSVGDARVTVGPQFALLPLLTALQRDPWARVIVLSQARTRCVDVSGRRAAERDDFGFPLTVEPPREADTPHRDFPLDEHEADEAVNFVFRAVDDALAALQRHDRRPILLFATERDLAYFDAVTTQQESVIGRRAGNYERSTVSELADLARPLLDAHRVAQGDTAGAEIREAIGSRAVAGVADVWAAARAGRGHRLLVEASSSYPARLADGGLVAAGTDDAQSFDAVEDTVAEVLRHGGEVVVAEPDRLADLGHIALITRF